MKLKISRISFILFVELFLVMPFQAVVSNPLINVSVRYAAWIALLFELGIFASLKQKNTAKKGYIGGAGFALTAFVLFQSFISVWNHSQSNFITFTYLFQTILVVLVISKGFRYNIQIVLNTISLFFYLAILLNLISVIIWPNGIYETISSSGTVQPCFFLGIDNQLGKYLFPGFSLIWFNDMVGFGKPKFRTISSLGIIFLTYILTMSGTGLMVSLILILLFALYLFEKLEKLFSFKVYFAILALITVGLLAGTGFIYTNSFISDFIYRLTGKTMTFTGRTFIWSQGVSLFLSKPWVGYGKLESSAAILWHGRLFSAHNTILQILLESGIVGLCLFVSTIVTAGRAGDRVINSHREVRVLYIGILTTLIYFSMEVGTLIPMYILLLVLHIYSSYQE